MATTSLWHIKGRLKDLIDYVENPKKTVSRDKCLQDFYNVFSYVSRPEATENGEYVSAINCLKEIALQQMILTKSSTERTTDISLGTDTRALSLMRLHHSRHTRLD